MLKVICMEEQYVKSRCHGPTAPNVWGTEGQLLCPMSHLLLVYNNIINCITVWPLLFHHCFPSSPHAHCLTLSYLVSPRLVAFYLVFSSLVLSCLNFVLYCRSWLVLSCPVLSCLIVFNCLALACDAVRCVGLCCLALLCVFLSCLVSFRLDLYCLVLHCLVLSCLDLSFF